MNCSPPYYSAGIPAIHGLGPRLCMESVHNSRIAHWDHEPVENQGRSGIRPYRFIGSTWLLNGRSQLCLLRHLAAPLMLAIVIVSGARASAAEQLPVTPGMLSGPLAFFATQAGV